MEDFFEAVFAILFIGVVVFVVGLGGFGIAQSHYRDNPDGVMRREAVCTYLGGHVEGKVCVKGHDIIETRFK